MRQELQEASSAIVGAGLGESDMMHFVLDSWYRRLPDEWKPYSEEGAPTMVGSRDTRRTRLVLYLRQRQMGIAVHMATLRSGQIMGSKAVEGIINAVRVILQELRDLDETSTVYQMRHMYLGDFVISSVVATLVVLALATGEDRRVAGGNLRLAVALFRRPRGSTHLTSRLMPAIRGLRDKGVTLRAERAGQDPASVLDDLAGMADGASEGSGSGVSGVAPDFDRVPEILGFIR